MFKHIASALLPAFVMACVVPIPPAEQAADAPVSAALEAGLVAKQAPIAAISDYLSDARGVSTVLKPWRDAPLYARSCSAAGDACCPPDSSVPTQHCLGALGCNVGSGKCEPCGGPSQVCCDGPLTAFNGKPYSYEPTGDPEKPTDMCRQPGSCDVTRVGNSWTGSRICHSCGTQLGGACCPPDDRYALGRCSGMADTIVSRIGCDQAWNWTPGAKCVMCGSIDMPPCDDQASCDPGLVERGGVCVACGYPGMPPCDDGCRSGAHHDRNLQLCVQAGGQNQPCSDEGLKCGYQGLFCDAQRFCRQCDPGQACCEQQACMPLSQCSANRCEACGREGQPCCRNEQVWGQWRFACDGPNYCEAGVCRRDDTTPPARPAPNPPNEGPKTCGGNPWGLNTVTHQVPIKYQNTQCVTGAGFSANSYAEALQCAAQAFPGMVVDGPTYTYQFALYSDFGCNNVTLTAEDESDAETCAWSQCLNCNQVVAGTCF